MKLWRLVPPIGLVIAAVIASRPHASPPPVLSDNIAPEITPPLADAPVSIDELRRRVAGVLEREHVPGVAIALVDRDGPIWIGGVGVADLKTRVPVDANTVFRAASITKSFIGLGVMRLVEQGKLDLDRPIRELLPDVAIENRWDSVAPVTLAHVLEHTAGFDDMRFNEVFTSDDVMSADAALRINPRSRVVRWRPGTRGSYSNVGYTVAGRAIEVATGELFDVWLKREVLVPLGMETADFRRTPDLAARLATGYIEPDQAARFTPIAHRPAGALLASATDLAKLVQFWLRRDGSLVSVAGLARIERCGTSPYGSTDIDYGLGNYGDVSLPAVGRGHNGGLPGFLSELRYFPTLGRGFVILLNATYSFNAYFQIRRLVFGYLARGRALTAPAAAPAATPPGADFFEFASPRHQLFGFIERALLGWHTVENDGGVRIVDLQGGWAQLVPARDGAYRILGQSGSSIRFAKDVDGQPAMLLGSAYARAASWWGARARLFALGLALFLMQLAPLWAGAVLAMNALQGRRVVARGLLVWPAIAALCFLALEPLLIGASQREALGTMNPWTVALCASTIVFAFASGVSLAAALRWSLAKDRQPLIATIVPIACAFAACALALWLGVNGLIGLRTWAW